MKKEERKQLEQIVFMSIQNILSGKNRIVADQLAPQIRVASKSILKKFNKSLKSLEKKKEEVKKRKAPAKNKSKKAVKKKVTNAKKKN